MVLVLSLLEKFSYNRNLPVEAMLEYPNSKLLRLSILGWKVIIVSSVSVKSIKDVFITKVVKPGRCLTVGCAAMVTHAALCCHICPCFTRADQIAKISSKYFVFQIVFSIF